MAMATRGALAQALFNALEIQTTSTGRFSDAGYLDAITSTLADLGVTSGIGGGQYGTSQPATRGQAFTMIARALGLADTNTSIEAASQALVDAGIVKGYNNDPTSIGINDPLREADLGLLMTRLTPELDQPSGEPDGSTIGDQIQDDADDASDANRARYDPAYAAFLQAQGLRRSEIDDAILMSQGLFEQDTDRRSDMYGRATERAMKGIGTDFENRGLFSSGVRSGRQAERFGEIGYDQAEAQYQAQRQQEQALRGYEATRAELDRQTAIRRAEAEVEGITDELEEEYG